MIVLLMVSGRNLYAQKQGQPLIDSLLKELPRQKEDTNKVKVLNDLSLGYHIADPDTGIFYGKQALVLATKLGYAAGEAWANSHVGLNYVYLAGYGAALQYYDKAAQLFKQAGNNRGIAWVAMCTGNIFKARGEFPKALEYYLKALKLDEELGNKKDIAAVTLNIGTIYTHIYEYAKAREYFNRALAGAEEVGDKRTINVTERCIGVLFRQQGILDSALFYYNKALRVAEEINDKSSISSLAADMGAAYYEQGYYATALAYSGKALQLKRELGAKTDVAVCLTTVGWIYIKLATDTSKKVKAFDVAELRAIDPAYTPMPGEKHALLKRGIENIRESISIFKEAGNMDDVASGYYNLARADSLNGDYHEALIALCLSTRLNDSLFSMKKNMEISTLAIHSKMEADSLNNVHGKQVIELKLKQQRGLTYVSGAVILALLGFSFFIIKERRKAEAERKNAEHEKARAERSEQFKQQFLANMSHEIRTPMNAVLGMTNLVMDTEVTPKQDQYLKAIKKSSENLLVIINDILDLSKLEAGKMELEKIPFRISEQLTQAYETIHFKAEEKGLVLQTEIDKDVPEVLVGDPSRLNQVLINLSANAIKFTDKGNVRITVKKVPGTESSLAFTVADTGIGIPADKLGSLFESFQQVDASTSRKYGGTGLGLSISKTLIELQGGKIEVKSEEGKGSEFSFTIAYGIPTGHEAAALTKETKIDSSLLTGIRILVAEDNDYNQIVIQDTLENIIKGVKVDIADNGRIAIEKLRTGDYDVILMDAQMPVMGGLEASEYIRKNLDGKKGSIPILALTASVLNTDLDKCIKAGMNDYVPKPFTRAQLLNTLAKYYRKDV